MGSIRAYRVALMLFVLALIVRVLLATPTFASPDASVPVVYFDGYYQIAKNLLARNGFSHVESPPYIPDAMRAPLYPLIVASIIYLTGSYKVFTLLQILIGSAIPLLGRKIADLMTGHSGIALGVGLFLAVEPFAAWVSTAILTETFFTFFFLLGCIAFLSYLKSKRTSRIVWCALFLGCATLIKPTTQFLPILFCAVVLFKEWRPSVTLLRQLLVFLLVFVLVLAPWMYHNYTMFKNLNLNAQTAVSLYVFLVPSVIALERGETYETAATKFLAENNVKNVDDITLENASHFQELAVKELYKHPIGLLHSGVVTFVTFFTHDGYRTFTDYYPFLSFKTSETAGDVLHSPQKIFSLLSPGIIFVVAGRALWIFISIAAICGFYLWMKARKFSIDSLIVAVIILYFVGTTAIVGLGVNGRYRYPISAFLVTLAFFACMRIASLSRETRAKSHLS